MRTQRGAALLMITAGLAACDGIYDPSQPGNLVPRTVDEDPTLPALALAGTVPGVRIARDIPYARGRGIWKLLSSPLLDRGEVAAGHGVGEMAERHRRRAGARHAEQGGVGRI